MSRSAKWAVGGILAAVVMSLPAAALAAFPGENGQLVFVSGRNGGDAQADVHLLEAVGDLTPTPITTLTGQHRHPAVSPDLTRIAYAVHNAGDHELYIQEIGGPPPTTPVQGGFSPAITEDRPSWSPDGTKLAYEREVDLGGGESELDIMIYDLETNTEDNLTASSNFDEGKPVWTPDGETIYYSIGASSPMANVFTPFDDIMSEPVEGGAGPTEILVSGVTEDYQPSLSPDGEQLCFTRGPFGSPTVNVFTVAADGSGTPQNVSDTANTVGGYNCAWSPDGEFIAWVEGTFGNGSLLYEPSDDAGTAQAATSNEAAVFDGNPDWAPADPAFCKGEPAQIAGTSGNDTLDGTDDDDVIVAHAGNDVVNAGGGNDLICGSDGNDRIKGGGGKDRAFGEAGKDKLNGGGGKDKLQGGGGKDKLKGAGGKDKLKGQGGKDKLVGGGGKDKLNGGGGKDVCVGDAKDKLKSCEK